MAKFNVVDMNGQHVSEIELSDAVFGITPNEKAVHIAVVNFLANQRQGTQNTKIRMEVSGGGKKPWRQKGTGHARQGSTRAPQWTHGGIVFAPKPRSYSYVLNKKVKRLAMKSALSAKAAAGEIIVIALIVTFLPITLPFKIVLAMVAMACFYFGRKYYHNHKNGGAETPSMSSAESEALASGILKALGGKNNIVKVDYCATRLRFEVHSYASVDEAAAKAAGAEGVIRPAKNACQVVIKGDVQAVYDALRKQL